MLLPWAAWLPVLYSKDGISPVDVHASNGCFSASIERAMQLSYPFKAPVKTLFSGVVAVAAMYMGSSLAPAHNQSNPAAESKGQACPIDDSGLQLPAGFCATVFADEIGHARHMVAAPSGVLYVNTWSGRYYGNDPPHAAAFLLAPQHNTRGGNTHGTDHFPET